MIADISLYTELCALLVQPKPFNSGCEWYGVMIPTKLEPYCSCYCSRGQFHFQTSKSQVFWDRVLSRLCPHLQAVQLYTLSEPKLILSSNPPKDKIRCKDPFFPQILQLSKQSRWEYEYFHIFVDGSSLEQGFMYSTMYKYSNDCCEWDLWFQTIHPSCS